MNAQRLPRITFIHPRAAARIAGLLALALILAVPVHTGTAEGIAAFKVGDYERAYVELKLEAEQHRPMARIQ